MRVHIYYIVAFVTLTVLFVSRIVSLEHEVKDHRVRVNHLEASFDGMLELQQLSLDVVDDITTVLVPHIGKRIYENTRRRKREREVKRKARKIRASEARRSVDLPRGG